MANKFPWFKFYAEDWMNDLNVQTMGPIERLFYFETLCLIWMEDGVPKDEKFFKQMLSKCLAVDTYLLSKIEPKVQESYVKKVMSLLEPTEDGRKLTHWKLEEQRTAKMKKRRSAQENGSKGGKAKANNYKRNPKKKPPSKRLANAKQNSSYPDPLSIIQNSTPSVYPPTPQQEEAKIGGEDHTPDENSSLEAVPESYRHQVDLEEVVSLFSAKGLSREDAEAWFHEKEGVGWMHNGCPVSNWRALALSYINHLARKRSSNPTQPRKKNRL